MIFFLQMFVILAACRLCGWVVRRFLRQPQVIGEMIAGVILGPSLLGSARAGASSSSCFRRNRSRCSYAVAQIGIAIYMFLVGLDFRSEDFKSQRAERVAVSVSGIVVPFLVAIVATPWLMSVPDLFVAGRLALQRHAVPRRRDRDHGVPRAGAHHPRPRARRAPLIATQALSAAAIGDAVAWCVVAVVLASLGAGARRRLLAIGGGARARRAAHLVRPATVRAARPAGRARSTRPASPSVPTVLAAALMLCTLSAYVSDAIGLHAVFGAFLIGTAMPRGVFAQRMRAAARAVHAGVPAAGVLHVLGPQHAAHDGEHAASCC